MALADEVLSAQRGGHEMAYPMDMQDSPGKLLKQTDKTLRCGCLSGTERRRSVIEAMMLGNGNHNVKTVT